MFVFSITSAVLVHSPTLEAAAWPSVGHHRCPPGDSCDARHELWPPSSIPSEAAAGGTACRGNKGQFFKRVWPFLPAMSAEIPDTLIPDYFTHDSSLQMEGNPLRSLPVCVSLSSSLHPAY